jgi:ribosomal protein S19E (S16A)
MTSIYEVPADKLVERLKEENRYYKAAFMGSDG